MRGVIILDEDLNTRLVLQKYLQGMGYKNVRATSDFDSADYLLDEYPDGLDLVIASDDTAGGLDLPLFRYLIQKRELDLAPLIMTTNLWMPTGLTNFSMKHSRIDAVLSKPFNLNGLVNAIASAHVIRAKMRSCLVVVSNAITTFVADSVFNSKMDTHWTIIENVTDASSFNATIEKLGFRAGTILVDPDFADNRIVESLNHFSKTQFGSRTPIATFQQEGKEKPGVQAELRRCSQIVATLPKTIESFHWDSLLNLLSRRLLHSWEARFLMAQGRRELSSEDFNKARRTARIALEIDSVRWEFHELAGEAAFASQMNQQAAEHYKQAIKTNPSSPLPYLRLLKVVEEDEKDQVISLAEKFCSSHPQVMAAIQSEKLKRAG